MIWKRDWELLRISCSQADFKCEWSLKDLVATPNPDMFKCDENHKRGEKIYRTSQDLRLIIDCDWLLGEPWKRSISGVHRLFVLQLTWVDCSYSFRRVILYGAFFFLTLLMAHSTRFNLRQGFGDVTSQGPIFAELVRFPSSIFSVQKHARKFSAGMPFFKGHLFDVRMPLCWWRLFQCRRAFILITSPSLQISVRHILRLTICDVVVSKYDCDP